MMRRGVNEVKAEKFIISFFREIFKLWQEKKQYKWRDIKVIYKSNGKYLLTDSVNKFIYSKDLWEYIIITYAKKTEEDKAIHWFMNYFNIK